MTKTDKLLHATMNRGTLMIYIITYYICYILYITYYFKHLELLKLHVCYLHAEKMFLEEE